jgi:uncharacterized protein (TIRG00374 family)
VPVKRAKGVTEGVGGRHLWASRGLLARMGGFLLSLGALWLVGRSVDLGAAANVLSDANPLPLVACLGLIGIQVLLRSVRWSLLLPLKPGGERASVRRIAPVLLVGYLGNAVLPARLGEPIRAYLVARREKLDTVEAFGSVVLERVVDTATLAAMAFLAAEAVDAPTWIVRATGLAAAIGVVFTFALVTVGPGRLVQLTRRAAAVMTVETGAEPILMRLDDFARGIERPSRSGAVIVAAIVSVACWILDATTFWLVARSVGVSISPAAAFLIGAVTVLGTALPSAPGYVGTFDLAAAATAQAVGVLPAAALALAVLAHAMTVLPMASAGAAALVVMDTRLGQLAGAARVEGGFSGAAGT